MFGLVWIGLWFIILVVCLTGFLGYGFDWWVVGCLVVFDDSGGFELV